MKTDTGMKLKRMRAEDVQEDCRQRGFLARRLYVVFTTPSDDLDLVLKHVPAHLDYQVELERKGIMFAAGPLMTDDDAYCEGEGMIVIRAASLAEAEAIAEADPMHMSSGARSYRIRPWLVNEGSLHIKINMSTGKFDLN